VNDEESVFNYLMSNNNFYSNQVQKSSKTKRNRKQNNVKKDNRKTCQNQYNDDDDDTCKQEFVESNVININSRSNKCSFCERRRERNDLCNRCRQKVECRAHRLLQQKLVGDIMVTKKLLSFIQNNFVKPFQHQDHNKSNGSVNNSTVYNNNNSNVDICETLISIYPFLMIKFQIENMYRGKKGSKIWCIPDSILRKMCAEYFHDDNSCHNNPSSPYNMLAQAKRHELYQIVNNFVLSKMKTFYSKYEMHNVAVIMDTEIGNSIIEEEYHVNDDCNINDDNNCHEVIQHTIASEDVSQANLIVQNENNGIGEQNFFQTSFQNIDKYSATRNDNGNANINQFVNNCVDECGNVSANQNNGINNFYDNHDVCSYNKGNNNVYETFNNYDSKSSRSIYEWNHEDIISHLLEIDNIQAYKSKNRYSNEINEINNIIRHYRLNGTHFFTWDQHMFQINLKIDSNTAFHMICLRETIKSNQKPCHDNQFQSYSAFHEMSSSLNFKKNISNNIYCSNIDNTNINCCQSNSCNNNYCQNTNTNNNYTNLNNCDCNNNCNNVFCCDFGNNFHDVNSNSTNALESSSINGEVNNLNDNFNVDVINNDFNINHGGMFFDVVANNMALPSLTPLKTRPDNGSLINNFIDVSNNGF